MIVNLAQLERTVNKCRKAIEGVDKPIVAVLGLSFKPNTDNIRSAPSNILIEELLKLNAIVHAWDPIAEEKTRKNFPDIVYHKSIADALNNCSSAIIVTEWSELKEYFSKNNINIPIIDGRGIYPGAIRSIGRSKL